MKLHHALGPAALAAIMVVGCTPSAPAPVSSSPAVVSATPTATPSTPTKTPSPSPTLDRHQAAAVAALEGYDRATDEIEASPTSFTRSAMEDRIREWASEKVVDANVASYLDLAANGLHVSGSAQVPWQQVSPTEDLKDERGLRVLIRRCRDQRELRVIDRNGHTAASTEQFPAFIEHKFILRRPVGADRWRLFGWEAEEGDCR